ncbi:GNAT family N-acetyltransferase [Lichenicoccus roseus]|uniref:GNAT family N-acetyltransferase n=1 Tax=Lichenicoccus roseus TaxID=2683649 RepID=A0A5R9JB55_9PROT|nr:GNAT family N-acetyltransferase [Lichenicoccus roseus]TLU73767.1 GNAT family N-acetyltransferase [Lichenicoccus roseus]
MTELPSIDLEHLRRDHAAEMFEGLADPAGYRFLASDPPASVAALRSRYGRLATGSLADDGETWLNWVVRSRASGALVGYTQATIGGRIGDIGYHVFPACWRQGFATAALRATLDELFRAVAVDEVHAFVDTRNSASIALLAKLGFERLRTIVGADHFKGGRSDEYEFLLARRWWMRSTPP